MNAFFCFRCNFSDLEIEMFFVRYDVDGDFQFNNSETGRILDDLDHNLVERVPETSNETDHTRYYKG